jgi:hypothetical protein
MAQKKRNLAEEEQKQLLFLKSTYEMHCKTKEEAILRGKTKNLSKIEAIIKETFDQMAKIDANFARKCAEEQAEKNKKFDLIGAINNIDDVSLYDALSEDDEAVDLVDDEEIQKQTMDFYDQLNDDEVDLYEMADNISKTEGEDNIVDSFKQEAQEAKTNNEQPVMTSIDADEAIHNNVDPNAQYDLIPLPSKGECYKMKIDRVPVGYLTAADENLITSPNLYESGSISSILLKKKILNKNINVDNLIAGDVEAIMVFLRGTSYGNDFPIVATDPKNGKKVETTVDLSKLKYKPFNLKGDENGFFDFKLPRLGNVIKFKFLTKKEEKLLQRLNKKESQGVAVYDINEAIDKIKEALKTDDKMNESDRNQIIDASAKLEKWSENLSKSNKGAVPYTKTITNMMEMQIVSINGNTDKKFIHEFVMNMPASDSLAFRRYVYDNQPGVDFEVEVERPVSQGGGTFKCFLEWDDYVFWHIA